MDSKKESLKKGSYFSLPTEDRINFELEDKEQEEKDTAAEKVFEKLDKKKRKNK